MIGMRERVEARLATRGGWGVVPLGDGEAVSRAVYAQLESTLPGKPFIVIVDLMSLAECSQAAFDAKLGFYNALRDQAAGCMGGHMDDQKTRE